jgi:SAM-dependent methyltransferase
MLTGEQQKQYSSFLEGYPLLRRHEGWERDEAYYLALPTVPPGDPTSFVWNIRRRSLRVLDTLLAREKTSDSEPKAWALDLGAGNAWLSRHLTHLGYHTVALDLVVSGLDSLSGARLYIDHDGIWIGRIQASMSRLPLRDSAFALCAISAALHYADLQETLRSVHRVLQPGGLLLITDSPFYTHPEPGEAMAAERQAQINSTLGDHSPHLPGGRNYLVASNLLAELTRLGFSVQTIPTERSLGRLKRAITHPLRRAQREHAAFPVVAARKP